MAIVMRWCVLVTALSFAAGCSGTMNLDGGQGGGTGGSGGGGGNPGPIEACSGGCALSQYCDVRTRTCVDGCEFTNGSPCDAGLCVRVGTGDPPMFTCQLASTSCGGALCSPGQTTCRAGMCSCAGSISGVADSCRVVGRWCSEPQCRSPVRFEECVPNGAPCPTGHSCATGLLSRGRGICLKTCASESNCDTGEACGTIAGVGYCIASGAFRGSQCVQHVIADGGGFVLTNDAGITFDAGTDPANLLLQLVPVSNTCLLRGAGGVIADTPGRGSGNCNYVLFRTWDNGTVTFPSCRAPGNAKLGENCRVDYARSATATQCGTGMECAPVRGRDVVTDLGICMQTCNANIPAPFLDAGQPQPACDIGDKCVNIYRYQDPSRLGVVGVCMKPCDVFSSMSSCPSIGGTPTACVPVTPLGETVSSLDGTGVCVPQLPSVAPLGGTCAQVDPFRGAACASGQVCAVSTDGGLPVCTRICDTSCIRVDGGTVPARCSTQPNATCPGSTTCRVVTSTTGNRVGYCQ